MKKHFLTTSDLTATERRDVLELAANYKSGGRLEFISDKPLSGKSVALVFFNPSLRTRASMQVGIYELGGNAVVLEPGTNSWTLEHRENVVMDGDKTEHVKEFVQVLQRYVSAIGVRTFAALNDWEYERTDPVLKAFAKYADVPLINLESAMYHPCQAMADMMTIRELGGTSRKKVLLTWAWHPKPLPMAVPNSFALASAQFGHDLRIANPTGYDLDDDLISELRNHATANGGSVEIVNDSTNAFRGVDVVYAKSWGSKNFYGRPELEIENRIELRKDWIVDQAKMSLTNEAVFMHCLPVRRNVIVTDSVLDSERSRIIDEAENRLHVQKALLTKLLS